MEMMMSSAFSSQSLHGSSGRNTDDPAVLPLADVGVFEEPADRIEIAPLLTVPAATQAHQLSIPILGRVESRALQSNLLASMLWTQ